MVILHLPPSDVARIATRLWEGLEKRADGSAVRLADGPYVGSVFYASRETYDAFHTCNTWTALVLRDGGLPMNTHVLFAGQVMRAGVADRGAAGARRGDQQGGAVHWGRPRWYPAARRQWCATAAADCCC